MKPFIMGKRDDIHIIDLDQTVSWFIITKFFLYLKVYERHNSYNFIVAIL